MGSRNEKTASDSVDQAKLVVTSEDFDRLEALLESLPLAKFPGRTALQRELDRAQIVDRREVSPNVVTMNSKVRFRIEASTEEFCLRLVFPKDGEGEDRISILAPIGSALLGLSVGDELKWPLPAGGLTTVKVVEVLQQPEREGER